MEFKHKRYTRDAPKVQSSKGSSLSSAMERITSGKNMRSSLIPDFMRPSSQIPKSMAFYQAPERSKSPIFSNYERARSVSPEIDLYGSYISLIFDPTKDASEIILRVRQRDLYREDLRSFASGESLARTVIDASLSVIKQLNHDFLIKDEANDKVIISSTEFSQGIFCNSKAPNFHAPTYVMKYE